MYLLPDADEQVQAVLQAFPDTILILNRDNLILDFKGGEAFLSSIPLSDWINKKLQEMLPPDCALKFQSAISKLLRTDQTISFDFSLPHKLQLSWFEARLILLPHGPVAAFIRDITTRKETELTIRRQMDRLAALRTIEMAITSSTDLNLTMTMLVNQVKTQLNVDAACILLLDSQSQALKYTAGSGFFTDAFEQASLKLGDGYAGKALLTRQMIRIADLLNRKTDYLRSPFFKKEGFTDYFAVPLTVKGRVLGVLELFHRSPLSPNQDWLDFMNMLTSQASIAIDSALVFDNYERSNSALTMAYDATIEGWSRALELRDRETQGHTQRVTEMTVRLAESFGLLEQQVVHIRRGAMLHDIGKMAIPDSILLKPGPLDPSEWEIMRQHPSIAADLLRPIQYLAPALDIPQYHHEKWDGHGYPFRLKGEQIPLAARLFAVVDVYDALTSDRPYRKAWENGQAIAYIRTESGSYFDPKVVDFFLKMLSHETGL